MKSWIFLSALLYGASATQAAPDTDSLPSDRPVYFVIYQDVHDDAQFAKYVDAVTPAISRRGGRLLAAGPPKHIEGRLPHDRAVVFRYPSRRVLENFLASDEYAAIRPLREGAVDWLATIIPELPQENDAALTDPAVDAGETFGGTWPFDAHYSEAPGFRMHYIDEGAGDDTLLLLHGEPTWSYLYRNQIPAWARHARVIAVDHMGFGKSAAPRNRSYWLQDHIDNLEAFVLDLDLRNITLVMHDFGGPSGMGLAARHPDRIKRIVSVNGPTPFGQADLFDRLTANIDDSAWFQWIANAEQRGILEDVLGHLSYNILSTMKLNGFVNNDIVTDTWIEAYSAPFPTPAHSAGGIGWAKGFATGAHEFEEPSRSALERIGNLQAMAIWGEQDQTLNARHFLPLFRELFPNAKVHRLANAGHYSLEDRPEEITRLVLDFLEES